MITTRYHTRQAEAAGLCGGALLDRLQVLAGDAYVHAAVLAESRPRVSGVPATSPPAGRGSPFAATANDEDPLLAVALPVRMIQDIQRAASRSMEQDVLRPDAALRL